MARKITPPVVNAETKMFWMRRAQAAFWYRSASPAARRTGIRAPSARSAPATRSSGAMRRAKADLHIQRHAPRQGPLCHRPCDAGRGPDHADQYRRLRLRQAQDRPAGYGRIPGNRRRPAGADVQAGVTDRRSPDDQQDRENARRGDGRSRAPGSVILLGGFGSIGLPYALVDGLIEQGAKDLTVVANNAGVGRTRLAKLLDANRVRKIICSYPRTSDPGRSSMPIAPAASSLKSCRRAPWRNDARRRRRRPGLFRRPMGAPSSQKAKRSGRSPAAFRARRGAAQRRGADRSLGGGPLGQLTYRSSAPSTDPVIATAAKLTVDQAQHIVELRALDPAFPTPGIFVDRVLCALWRAGGDLTRPM